MLKAKKGFSLIELLVVIAIIGVLSAVGITAYSGYTADAKQKVTMAQHKQVVSFLNAESAKCAGGSGTFAFATSTACSADWSVALIKAHINGTMDMSNAYVPANGFAVDSAAEGATVITLNGTSAVITTTTVSGTIEANTIARY